MGKLLKVVGILVGIVLVLLVLAIALVPLLVDPDQFKGPIARFVEGQTGRQLVIHEEIGLSVFPRIALELGGVELANAPGFGEEPFARVGNAQVRVALVPLLSQRIEVESVALDGVELNLARDEQGRTNWRGLIAQVGPAASGGDAAGQEGMGVAGAAFSVGGIRVTNSRVHWEDRAAGERYELTDLSLELGTLVPGKPVDVALAFDVQGTAPAMVGRVEMSGTADIDPAAQQVVVVDPVITVAGESETYDLGTSRIELNGERLSVDLAGQRVLLPAMTLAGEIALLEPATALTLALDGALDADLQQQRIAMPTLQLRAAAEPADAAAAGWRALEAELAGDVTVDLDRQLVTAPALQLSGSMAGVEDAQRARAEGMANLKAQLDARRYELGGLTLSVQMEGDDLPDDGLTAALKGDLSVDLAARTLTLARLTLQAAGVEAAGQIQGRRITDDPRFSGSLAVAPFNPKAVLERLGQPVPATADPQALTAARLDVSFDATPTSAHLQQLALVLDQTTVTGSIDVVRFEGPVATFDLKADSLDLDRYRVAQPPAPGAAAPVPPPAAPLPPAEPAPIALPLDLLRGLDVTGTLAIGRLKTNNLKAQDVNVKMLGKDQILRLDPLSMNLYGGSLSQRVGLDVRQDVPAVQMAGQIQDVQIEPLLRDLGVESKIRGTSDFELDVATQGLTTDQLERNLDGTTRFMFTDGAIKGINIAYAIRRAKAALRGEPLPPERRELETDFSELSGSARIVDGILSNDDLMMKSPLLRVTGAGTIDIPRAAPDYRLDVTIVSTTKGQGGRELAELEGLIVPVQVAGTFEKLDLDVDIAAVLQELAKREGAQKVQDEVEGKLEQELKNRLGEEKAEQVKDAIKGLFGR